MKRPSKAIQHHLLQRNMLSAMLATSFSLATLPVTLLASPAIAAESEPAARVYDIPAGALDSALSRFAGEAGVVLSFEAEQAKHLATKGLKGHYTAKQGFDALLQGSGLQAVEVQAGRFTLKAVSTSQLQKSSTDTLPEVKVSAQSEHDGTTEGTASYQARYTNTAAKLALSPRETPQTITIMTRQQMDDFAMTTVDDALKAASGVFVYEGGGNGNTYYSRGFAMQSQYDGMLNPIGISDSNRNPQIDNAFLDRIEVLQGPSGLLNGAGSPGGTINLVRKRPTQEFQAHVELQVGSWDQRRLVGDVSGSLIESGRVRGRLIALEDDRNSYIDYAYNNKSGVYGVIEADLTSSTTVNASVQYQQDHGLNHLGVPFAADGSNVGLKRSSFFANPHGHDNKGYTLYSLGIEQKLDNDWVAKATYMRGITKVKELKSSWLYGDLDVATGDGLSLYQSVKLTREMKSDAVDATVSGPVTLWGRTHDMTVGLNGSKLDSASYNAGPMPTPINVYDVDPGSLPDPIAGDASYYKETTRQMGFFAVGRFSLADSVKLILGSRVSTYQFTDHLGTARQRETGVVTPYAGLVYDLDHRYSLYASYSDIFKPQQERESSGNTLKPVVGANYEMGIKGELLENKLNVAAAVFRLEQTNLSRLDPSIAYDTSNACQGYCYKAADKVVSQGMDLSANGEISTGWNLAASYTYVHSEYASGELKGDRYMTSLPQHSASASTNYRISGTDWSVGGNVRAYSSMYNTDGSTYTIRRAGVTIVGLTAKYRINKQTELNLIASNLFDRRYYATVDSLWWAPYAEPLKIMANLKYQF